MTVYPIAASTDWTVVCLCAAWCRTCDGYGPAFAQRAERTEDARHVWIDVEDDEDIVGELDIETFPTLLVLQGDRPMFFGPVLPHIEVVDRTLRALRQPDATAHPVDPAFRDVVIRITARLQGG